MSEETHNLCNMQGFGDPSGEHWLGNDVIHLLTISRDYTLQVQLKDVDGNQAYSQYDHFYIDGEEKKYRYCNTYLGLQESYDILKLVKFTFQTHSVCIGLMFCFICLSLKFGLYLHANLTCSTIS